MELSTEQKNRMNAVSCKSRHTFYLKSVKILSWVPVFQIQCTPRAQSCQRYIENAFCSYLPQTSISQSCSCWLFSHSHANNANRFRWQNYLFLLKIIIRKCPTTLPWSVPGWSGAPAPSTWAQWASRSCSPGRMRGIRRSKCYTLW